ncbi:MAG: serine hydrolase domain-containing protein [Xanthobacteraceae bacterium]
MAAIQSSLGFLGSVSDPLPRARPLDVGLAPERLTRIADVLNADIEAGKMPGAVLAIARRGRLAFLETYGMRDKAAGVTMTADSLFNIASMTKPVTTVAALQLLEQGKLLLDDPLSKYFPIFATQTVAVLDEKRETITGKVSTARPITLQDLMRHTSGLIYGGRGTTPVHKMYPEGSGVAGATMTGPEFLDKLSGAPLLHQPGAVWDYGFGLDVLGLVIEQITGQKLGDYFGENIFAPLGMEDTSYLVPAAKADRYAVAGPGASDGPVLHDCRKPLKFECGGACLASSATDYLRFGLALLNRGKFGTERILARKTAESMLSNQVNEKVDNRIANADPTRAGYGFGLGVAVRTIDSVTTMMGSPGEFNWPGAGGTNWWADPREDMVVVFMAVTPGPSRWHYRQLVNALVYQAIAD